MIRKLSRTRGARKFFRSRLATVSLVVIGLYVLVAVLVLCGFIVTLEESGMVVGPGTTPGFGAQSTEKRLRDAKFYLSDVGKALERPNVESALGEIALTELRIAAKPPEELAASVEAAWDIYDELAERKDDAEIGTFDAREAELRAAGITDRARIEAEAGRVADEALAALVTSEEFIARLDDLDTAVAGLFEPLEGLDSFMYSLRRSLGTDRQGRSISMRAIYSIMIALKIGAVTAFLSVLIGSLLGAAAAFFGGWVDHVVTWLYSTLSSIPHLVLLIVIAYCFIGHPLENTLFPVYAAFCLTFWIGPCRVVRGEVLKIKELEYVQAATAVGFGRAYILLRHVLPNTAHLMFINFSLLFIGAVKSEVILSFLGLGVKNQVPSWGVMIRDSRPEVINAFFWQIGTATFFMFVLVMAFNIVSDALQDAFDPKHVS